MQHADCSRWCWTWRAAMHRGVSSCSMLLLKKSQDETAASCLCISHTSNATRQTDLDLQRPTYTLRCTATRLLHSPALGSGSDSGLGSLRPSTTPAFSSASAASHVTSTVPTRATWPIRSFPSPRPRGMQAKPLSSSMDSFPTGVQ